MVMVAPHSPSHRPAAKATVGVIQNDHRSAAGEELETVTPAILSSMNFPDHERQRGHRPIHDQPAVHDPAVVTTVTQKHLR
jgi:hypothetical protein